MNHQTTAFLIMIAICVFPSLAPAAEVRQLHGQLTIYVAPPLLKTGGTVIVVSNPVSADEWRNMREGHNPAREDAGNAKQRDVGVGDRLFGAVASARVSVVEFVYPQGGTFGFNLVPEPTALAAGATLRTKRVLIGSGGWKEWSTGNEHIWENVSTIHVAGPDVSEGDSRMATAAEAEIMNLRPARTVYEGAIVYAPSEEQLGRILEKLPQ